MQRKGISGGIAQLTPVKA